MVGYRSENNKFPNKENYKDLNLTIYPNSVDTRINNINMTGFINIGEGKVPDYVMAEYVNAAIDGLMALERALGTTPMVPLDTPSEEVTTVIENFTVKDRLDRIENGLFDERYGGTGWVFNPSRPTLNNHNHSGKNGQPGNIKLETEVDGLLKRKNINLTNTIDGLTSSYILVNSGTTVTVEKALEDSLSKSTGGTVSGPLEVNNTFNTRTRKEVLASNIPGTATNKLINDNTATDGKALSCEKNTSSEILNLNIANMFFGKYVLSIRIKSSTLENLNLFRIRTEIQDKVFTGKDFDSINTWKQLYFVFNMNETLKNKNIIIEKLNTSSDVNLVIDNIIIETIHPGVLDR